MGLLTQLAFSRGDKLPPGLAEDCEKRHAAFVAEIGEEEYRRRFPSVEDVRRREARKQELQKLKQLLRPDPLDLADDRAELAAILAELLLDQVVEIVQGCLEGLQ